MKESIHHTCGANVLKDREFPDEPPPDVVFAERHDSYEEVVDDHGRASFRRALDGARTLGSTRVNSGAGTTIGDSVCKCASVWPSARRKAGMLYCISTRR